jgi:hypothetical protein
MTRGITRGIGGKYSHRLNGGEIAEALLHEEKHEHW